MKKIKTIAGDLLLYFYAIQRKNGIVYNDIIRFCHFGEPQISQLDCGNILFKGDILQISGDSLINLYNSFRYLNEKKFLEAKWDIDTGGENIFNLRVSALGIDIIEGIEQGKKERDQFNIIFNFKIADDIKIDSLIKTELGSIIKASLI